LSEALAAADADLRHAFAPLARSQPGSYLCHRYCALGASPLTEELRVVAEFLDAHPRDVVTLIIEDGIPVDETRRALADAGLTQMLHRHELGEGWPGRDLLLQRVRECSDVRGKRPNFIAVNFVEIGDVVGVVEELNGFGASS
jgi:hypothetical protein